MLDYHQEKLLFGLPSLAGSLICYTGAIMTTGEIRWIYVTLAVGVMTSAFLALLFKKETENIRLVVGRCGISIMLSVLGSRLVVHAYKIAGVDEDVLLLSAIAMGVCIAGYFIGHGFLNYLNKNSEAGSKGVFDFLLLVLRTFLTKKP